MAQPDALDLHAARHVRLIVWIHLTIPEAVAQVHPVQHIVRTLLTTREAVVLDHRAALHVLLTVRVLPTTLEEAVLGLLAALSVLLDVTPGAKQHVKKAVPKIAQVNVVTGARAIARQHVRIAVTMAVRVVAMHRVAVNVKAIVKVPV